MNLKELGWGEDFERHFEAYRGQGLVAARVLSEHRQAYEVIGEQGRLGAEVAGRLRHRAQGAREWPAVGDWVALRTRPEQSAGMIHAVLPRRSCFSRKAAGTTTDQQVLAANIETVLLVTGLDGDFNLRRIERQVAAAWDSGASPVVLLNKADLCADVADAVAQVQAIAIGAPVHAISAARGEGLEALMQYLSPGKTAALAGSSGVGKSTLVNRLLGASRQAVQAVRWHDSRGRHTTTRRELLLLERGGMLIDTPGVRELHLWDEPASLDGSFQDIARLAAECRFRDCRHETEPGCAVRRALETGELDPGRYENYRKLQRELTYLALRQDLGAQAAEKARWKQIARLVRKHKKPRDE